MNETNAIHARLDKLVARIEAHQNALRLNDSQFVTRFKVYIGSQKTWRDRLCARKWAELGDRLPKWEKQLSTLVTIIDGGSSVNADFFEKLPISVYGFRLYDLLQGQTSDRRNALLLGIYGSGKTWTLRRIHATYPRDTVYVRANETWKENKSQITSGLARALGCPVEMTPARTFDNIAEHLKGHPVTVLIDECHEAGVLLFKLVKTLIDESRAKFILGSYPTAWSKLCNGSTDAQAEAQQLLGRTIKPIETRWCNGINKGDVTAYLEAATGLNGQSAIVAEKILPQVRKNGNLRLLSDAVELAGIMADSNNCEITADLLEQSVAELCPLEREAR